MEWIEPVDVKSAVKFSSSLVNSTGDPCPNLVHGSIIESNLAWFAAGDRLDVVSTSHSGVQSRHFQCPQGQEFEVTCVAAVPNEPLILVGLSSNTGSGAVALYNYVTSLILNSWSISHKVTCVCSMEIPNPSYKQFLKSDCYLFALGTEEGHVMLLAIDQHFKFSAGTHQLELNIVHYVTTDDVLHKRGFFKPPVVLVIPLNDNMYRAGRFVLESMHETQAVLSVRQEEVSATVLRYIPQNQTLCVGYNTQGAFQLFSLKTLEIDFSGFAQGCNGEQVDKILDFAFLEPEDDPRHFCYLTVVAQRSSGSQLVPYALLYSLTYVNKDVSEGGILYDDLQYITLRMDLNFGSLILTHGSDSGSDEMKLLTCKSLPSSQAATTNNSTRATTYYGLCYFAISWKNAVYLAIFDLNQWYQAQMPSRWIFEDMSQLCPFMGFYHAEIAGGSARQVWIQSDTLSIFHRSSTTPSEAFFYPSALSFRAVVVCPQEAEILLFLGVQSLLLQKLSQAGSQVLSHPHRFYVQAMKAGLTSTEIVAPHATQMAEALLNIGLENNSRSFLISCIKDEGANLNFVEKWAWQQVVNLKSTRENLCNILFDHSTQEMEHQMHSQLYHVTHQFNNLSVLYDFMDKKIRALNSGVNDKLRDKSRAIYLLSLHLETVLWFLHGGLLPESDEGEDEGASLPYPRQQLEQFYRNRKVDIESLSSSVHAREVLLIEQLVPSSVVALWAEERGSNDMTYPPPSLYALLSAYLRPDVDDVTKHRLVQYVFMDLTWIYGRHPHYGNILQHLVTFPSTYSLKPSMIKVTQAFWHLDHQNFDDALGMLLDPLVHTMDITNAQQRAILRSFLYQDKRRHALKYATLRQPVCPELEDIQLHLTILIANSLISDALGYIRRNRNQRNSNELMQHLLSGCQEMRKISVLLTLPLADEEEDHVTNFLKQSRNIDLQEALLLFYIQRCKYPDAIAYSQRLNQMWPPRDAVSRERFNRREMLMQTLIGALPPITRKLAEIANSRPSSTTGGKFPRPLSVSVLPATSKVQSTGSNFFRTVIEQSRATWLIEQKLHQEVQTPLKTRKRKFDVPDLESEVGPESTPFLCNIVQPAQRNITLGMSLAFPSPKCVDASSMEITGIDMDMTQPKQGKRPRYSLFPKPLQSVKTDFDVISVLQTPPIRRSRASISETESISRPSSILKDKMRRFMNFSAFDTNQHPSSDADRSESETEMEVSTADTSAKHLRFNLPTQTVSPPASESEIVEMAHDDSEMELVEDTQHQSFAVDDSQFLSFEEDKAPALQVQVKEIVEQGKEPVLQVPVQKIAEEETEPVLQVPVKNIVEEVAPPAVHSAVLPEEFGQVEEAEIFDIKAEDSNNAKELTNIEATSPQKAVHFTSEVDNAEPAPVKKSISPSYEESEGSDIVCLDSSSEEEEDHDIVSKSEDVEEEEDYAEEEEDLEEEEDEDEICLKENEEDIEEVKDDSDVEEDEEEEFAQEIDPIQLETEQGRQIAEPYVEFENVSQQEYAFLPPLDVPKPPPIHEAHQAESDDVQNIPDDSEEFKTEQQSHYDAVPDSGNLEDSLQEESASEKDEMDSEADDEEEDQEVSEESDKDSPHRESKKFSLTGHQTMSTSYKKRFTMSSSEDENSNEDPRIQQMAMMRSPPVTGYSAVEPDFDCATDVSSPSPVPKQEEEKEEEEEPIEHAPELSGYSAVEPDMEDMEEDAGENEVIAAACEGTSADIVGSPDSPNEEMQDDNENSENVTSGEECEEEEQFELKFTDTPSSTVARRSVHRRRFSISSLASSGGEVDLAESSELTEEQQLKEPEMSPCLDRTEQPDSSSDQERRQRMRTARSSMFIKTRLQLSDTEESSDESDKSEPEILNPTSETVQKSDEQEVSNQTSGHVQTYDEQEVSNQKIDSPAIPESKVESDDEIEAEIEAEKSSSDSSDHSSAGSTTDENEDLKIILERHEPFQVPLIPDAAIIPTEIDLSTIAEERSFDQSTTLTLSKAGKSGLDVVEEEEDSEKMGEEILESEAQVAVEVEDIELEKEVEEVKEEVIATSSQIQSVEETRIQSSCSESNINILDAAQVEEENTFEPLQPLSSEDEDVAIELQVPKRKPGRPKSTKLSHVPLPFTSRRSVWEGDRDGSPDSVSSEPPQTFEEIVGAASKGRLRHHSANVTSAYQQIAPRRSKRLSTSISEAPNTPLPDEVPSAPCTPLKTNRRRSGMQAQDKDAGDTSVAPSLEASPTESSYSGRSSAQGTPMRRSARIALRERSPEPTASADMLLTSVGRIRRHSSGTIDISSPLRRSGRKSANVSRDNSPDSVTSEPPPRTEVTPSRKKPARTLKSAQKSVALNLFPVEEEAEFITELAGPSNRELSVARDSDESVSHDESVLDSGKKQKKSRSRPSSVASSPSSSSRYNLRRAGRQPELDIISEENVAQKAAETSQKRNREEQSEESSDQAGPAEPEEEIKDVPKKVTNKKRKKTEETTETEVPHFAPASRPPPKILPKREPVIKSRTSVRRSMRLDK